MIDVFGTILAMVIMMIFGAACFIIAGFAFVGSYECCRDGEYRNTLLASLVGIMLAILGVCFFGIMIYLPSELNQLHPQKFQFFFTR